MAIYIAAAIIIGYLLGSIPSAYIVARIKKGIDIRYEDTGNVGAMAVYREVGPPYGVLVLIGDMIKGALSIYAARWLGLDIIWISVAGFAAVAGHNWPVFLKFRGGRGGATIMGVLLAFMPVQFAIGFGIAAVIVIFSGNVRLGMIGLACIPLIAWLFERPPVYIYYPLVLVIFVAVYAIIGTRETLGRAGGKTKVFFNRDFNIWRKKDKKANP